MKTISSLFDPRPNQWGLRGDPFLWDELKVKFDDAPIPESRDEFEGNLINAYIEFVGETPERSKNCYINRYNIGGMSGGYVCSDWWLEIGFPLILNRYMLLNK